MRLYYANAYIRKALAGRGNFGDDLNPWIWHRVLPDTFDDDPTVSFVGIGTLLNERLPHFKKTIVFGAGHGFGKPPVVDSRWHVYCVRGPLTARALDLPMKMAVADPAILVRRLFRGVLVKNHKISYMPHAWEIHRDQEMIQAVCRRLGFHCIDPRDPVDQVLVEIASSEMLISEAMHGAIVADALRVPWAPIRTNAGIPPFKWQDWCSSLGLSFEDNRVLRGARIKKYFSAYERVDEWLLERALRRTYQRQRFLLSDDTILLERIEKLEYLLAELRHDIKAGILAFDR